MDGGNKGGVKFSFAVLVNSPVAQRAAALANQNDNNPYLSFTTIKFGTLGCKNTRNVFHLHFQKLLKSLPEYFNTFSSTVFPAGIIFASTDNSSRYPWELPP